MELSVCSWRFHLYFMWQPVPFVTSWVACISSRRWRAHGIVPQKEAAKRRHEKFTQLLAQDGQVRLEATHIFSSSPPPSIKTKNKMVEGWGKSHRRMVGKEEEFLDGCWKAEVFILSACQQLMIELKKKSVIKTVWKAVWKIHRL